MKQIEMTFDTSDKKIEKLININRTLCDGLQSAHSALSTLIVGDLSRSCADGVETALAFIDRALAAYDEGDE